MEGQSHDRRGERWWGVAEFVQDYAALRWSVVAAFLVTSAIVTLRLARPVRGHVDSESDAAHLVMCLIMLVMLIFPTEASPHAVRGVLIAMTVAFGALLVSRIVEWRAARGAVPAGQIFAIGYHALAAAAMLYAMSGHSATGHAGPPPLAAYALAALFVADGLTVLCLRGGGWHRLAHPVGAVGSAAVVPHVVMDLGMAYMLVAAALG
ncbi:uncharacterized protein DUF5134 [Nocardia bhagyanarayanae]|uniref:Uncharacterized protein DUF5134 n=1 Tax=Nocardia bhagyanarayanae TaxID=1215925 RepID=A0A543FCZ0_9NOCA|nr:uncharacterized protein DUF5134 [Nocardia bhagyanarayanae]